jgi:large subunit ribosomal protein L5
MAGSKPLEKETMPVRLREKYQTEVVPAMMQEFKYSSVMQVPRLVKIVANIGVGEAIQNAKALEAAVGDLTIITGQKPVVTKAKKSVAAFKLREGMAIGAMVTLRSERMYDFYDRLVNLALPRIRDFRGLSRRSFDGRGNYSLGLREQIVFPDIDYDKIDKIRGLELAIVTTATNDEQAYALLKRLGMPFRD